MPINSAAAPHQCPSQQPCFSSHIDFVETYEVEDTYFQVLNFPQWVPTQWGCADMPGEMGLLLGFSASPGHPCKQANKTNWIEINKLNRKIENKKERD